MRPKTPPRRGSRPGTQHWRSRRTVRPGIEILEARVVPSNIDYSMGFADHSGLGASGSASFPVIAGKTVAQLTDGGSNETGSILTNDTFGTSQFKTDFNFVQSGQTIPTGGELDFILQNSGKNIGVYFALDSHGSPVSLTGVTMNGQASSQVDLSGYGIDLHSQDPMRVNVTYDGSALLWTIQDTITNVKTPHITFTVDIASLLGNAANVGFKGTTGTSTAVQYIQIWTGDFGTAPTSPTLTTLSRNSAPEGSTDLVLTLTGSNFPMSSAAQWNGTSLQTTFLTSNQLTALVPASLLAEEGTAAVAVFDPSSGSTSNALPFTITDAPLTGSSVSFTATQGTPFTGVVAAFSDANNNAPLSDFTATITWGDGNVSAGTVASLGGGNFSVSGANTYLQSGSFLVSVLITDVGGATTTVSSSANVASAANLPVLTSLSTTTAQEGSGSLVLTLNGSNFVSNSTALWNGSNVATTFVSANQLIAVVPASLLAEEGMASLTVSTPGAGTSGALPFTITDAPLTGSAASFTATQGTPFTGVVAAFSDANSNAPLSDFTATITWGDGNVSAGTVASLGGGNFSVSGANTYLQSGSFLVSVLITDVGGATALFSTTTNVGSGSTATTITLSSSANPAVVGSPVSFTAVVTSGSGTPTGSVQFVVNNISITIGLVNGVATSPSISGLAVGQYAVVASYIPTGSFSPSSATLIQTIINPASTASMLVLSGLPSVLTAGTTSSVTLTAEDANGNIVTGYTGTILFSSTDPSATLPSPYSFTSADAGSHTFPNGVIFQTAGSQTLTAIDTISGIRGTATVTVSPTSAIADGTVLLLSSPVSGQLAPTGIIGIDPTTGAQAPIATGGSFVLPQVVREAADHQLYIVDYSTLGTGAVIAVDPNTGKESRVYAGGNINGPNALAILNGSLYVTNQGGSAPSLVKIDIATGAQSLVPINGTVTNPVGLAPTPTGSLYLADQGSDGVGTISILNVQTGSLTPLSPPPSQADLLDRMIDLGLDGSGNLVAFISANGGGVIEVNSQTGNQTSLVSGLFSDPSLNGLVLDGGTVDIAHGGTIFVSAYDPSGNLSSRLLAIDPVSGAVRTVSEGGNLSLVTGLTVFTTIGGAAAAVPSAAGGWALHAGVMAAAGLRPADPLDPSATGIRIASSPVTIPPQLSGVRPPLAAAPSEEAAPGAATDAVFAAWDGGPLAEAFSADSILPGMASQPHGSSAN